MMCLSIVQFTGRFQTVINKKPVQTSTGFSKVMFC